MVGVPIRGRGDAAGVDGQVHARERFAFAHDHAAQGDAVATGLEFQVVAHMHRRRQEAHFLGKLAPYPLMRVSRSPWRVLSTNAISR